MNKSSKIGLVVYILVVLLAVFELAFQDQSLPEDEQTETVRDSCMNLVFLQDSFSINKLSLHDLPYVKKDAVMKIAPYYDDDSIPLDNYNTLNYQPSNMAQFGLHAYDVFLQTGDKNVLDQAKKVANKLASCALKVDSCLFFPFSFNFRVHGLMEETMMSPWYSAIAQGQALSLFARLYETTGDSTYLKSMHQTFRSFQTLKGENDSPWITCIDDDGYLWLETYPSPVPTRVLNGMIIAIFGIYDYYSITANEAAADILRGALTTIKAKAQLYRKPGDIGLYGLKHNFRSIQSHMTHIEQFKVLYKITGDTFFETTASQFQEDIIQLRDRQIPAFTIGQKL